MHSPALATGYCAPSTGYRPSPGRNKLQNRDCAPAGHEPLDRPRSRSNRGNRPATFVQFYPKALDSNSPWQLENRFSVSKRKEKLTDRIPHDDLRNFQNTTQTVQDVANQNRLNARPF